jgi:hypothetical protein
METDIATGFAERLNGPFSLRLLLQPSMALMFAIRDGRKDALTGANPYLNSILFQSGQRRDTIKSAWASVGKVMIIAFILDGAFQFATGRSISIIEAAGMAALLCAVPYTLMRGPAARIALRNK